MHLTTVLQLLFVLFGYGAGVLVPGGSSVAARRVRRRRSESEQRGRGFFFWGGAAFENKGMRSFYCLYFLLKKLA